MVPDTPAKFHRPSLPGSERSSKTGTDRQTDRPTEFAIAICRLVDTKCHKKQGFQLPESIGQGVEIYDIRVFEHSKSGN